MQLQQPTGHVSQQLQRQQVLSATPAQLSQVKAFVSQAQLQASLSRSNSPLGASLAQQSVKSAIAAAAAAAAANNSSASGSSSQISQQVVTAAGSLSQATVQLHASTVRTNASRQAHNVKTTLYGRRFNALTS